MITPIIVKIIVQDKFLALTIYNTTVNLTLQHQVCSASKKQTVL